MFTIKIILFGLISKSICSDVDLDIVNRLKIRYNNSSSICLVSQNRLRPAYDCSGLLIRGVNFDKNRMKYPWSVKKSNNPTNAFSFAFLRTDQLFSSFPDHDAGFIIYPLLETPSKFEENKLKVFCAFPLDAHTNNRIGFHRCGQTRNEESGTSRECDVQVIDSLTKWISHYKNITNSENSDFSRRQCGFDMTTENAANVFQVALAANIYIREHSERYSYINNELRVEAWNEENCEEIPIEAFFYIIDSHGAEAKATNYRDLFDSCSGRKLPIVGLRLPTADRDLIIEIY